MVEYVRRVCFRVCQPQVSTLQLRMYLDEQSSLPLETLNEIVAEVNYGGRITDDKDQRCCRSILCRYFCKEILDVRIWSEVLQKYVGA